MRSRVSARTGSGSLTPKSSAATLVHAAAAADTDWRGATAAPSMTAVSTASSAGGACARGGFGPTGHLDRSLSQHGYGVSVCLSVCLSIYLSVCLSVCVCVHSVFCMS